MKTVLGAAFVVWAGWQLFRALTAPPPYVCVRHPHQNYATGQLEWHARWVAPDEARVLYYDLRC